MKCCNLFGMILLQHVQLLQQNSFLSFLTGCPDLATGHSAIDLNIQSFFLLVSRRIYIYINTHIISYVYINRMIWAQKNLAKFGYRSEMKVEKFRNGAIFWPHANNLKLSKYGYFTKKGKWKNCQSSSQTAYHMKGCLRFF